MRTISSAFFFVLYFLVFVSCSTEGPEEMCIIDKGLDYHRPLTPFTEYVFESIPGDTTISFSNSFDEKKVFNVSKTRDIRFWGVSFNIPDENCEYEYLTNRDYHQVRYSNTMITESIEITYSTSGYSLLNNNMDSLVALYDRIGFSSGNASSVGTFAIDREEGPFNMDDTPDHFFVDYLKLDTIINATSFDSLYILPNDFHDNQILYSIPHGIVQFEDEGHIWNIDK